MQCNAHCPIILDSWYGKHFFGCLICVETHVDMFLEVWPCSFTETVKFQVDENSSSAGPSTSTSAAADSQNDEVDDDDDELDMDELDELEASLSRTSIQIREPGIKALS
ncbi:hypothetical protein RJ640_013304 [Escallonia rubra]|uniref:Uncharacterized protein n=1 Tax=Escallonia rubra TaxID=112253 RepID=A0AA88RC93_9ASTE|nr:hypothetical protein RJ640_013304 [Escallonia rubra]